MLVRIQSPPLMLKFIREWLNKDRCKHPKDKLPFFVSVHGSTFQVNESDKCRICTQDDLNRTATVCAQCGKAIVNGQVYVECPMGKYSYSYAHASCHPKGLAGGVWPNK